jgi:hypothetical protein
VGWGQQSLSSDAHMTGGRVYYQQQVLATVPRSDFGTGF